MFELVDSFTTLNVVSVDGGIDPTSPIATIWPLMRWVSLVIATGLFFLQLATTMLRGGRGMFRLATGPLAYAVAVGMTAGGIGLLFAAGDGLTTMMLDQGLKADGFVGVLDSPAAAKFFIPAPNLDAPTSALDPVSPQARAESAGALASQLDATTRAVVLGIVAVFAVIPAGLGFLLENIFRLAVFAVLVATSPVTAAGLLADATASWFWRGLRWAITAAVLKPALALVLIIGVTMLSEAERPERAARRRRCPAGCPVLPVRPLPAAGVRRSGHERRHDRPRVPEHLRAQRRRLGRRRGGGGSGSDGSGGGDGGEAAHAARFDAAGGGSSGAAGTGGAGAGGTGAGAGGGGAAAAGAGAAGVIAGVGAAVAAAGQFAGQYANQTMDASGIGHPHGGRGGAPTAARGGGDQGHGGSPSGGGGSGGPDDNGPDASSTLATAPEYGDHDRPGLSSGSGLRPRLRRRPGLWLRTGLRLRPR